MEKGEPVMDCPHCGAAILDSAKFCRECGAQNSPPSEVRQTGAGVRWAGYSERIGDPAFARYIKNTNRWSAVFSVALAVIAVVGFFIAGEMGLEDMENPQSLYIGLGIGGMFIAIALFQILGRKRSRTWDGQVVDKTVKKKSRVVKSGNDDSRTEYYTEYAVFIRENGGKVHRLTAEDDDTVYNYYRVGDHVRHHAGLNSYEKYDKTQDSSIFCSACSTLCDIDDDVCFRCKCPLLK